MVEVKSLIQPNRFGNNRISHNALTLILSLFAASSVSAGPAGGNVTLGSANINQAQQGVTTVTQSTDRAVIDWDSFNVNQDELVSFNQPSATSITVNRDISGQLSNINGEVTANGQIFILNPAGVMFGADAFVNVGGLVASDLDVAEDMAGSGGFVLSDPNVSAGGVTNEGVLRASSGGIALIGQQITNSGEVRTRAGDVQLISASEVAVLVDPEGGIGFELTQPVRNLLPGSDYLIENTIDGVVVSIDGGDVVYSTRYVEDLLSGGESVKQDGTETVAGFLNQAGDIYVSETGVAETLVDTVIDDMITRDSAVAATDAGETAAELDEDSENLANADTLDYKAQVEGRAKGKKDKNSRAKQLALKIDPNYFAKLRKTHIDQLIPDCKGSNCDSKQEMKAFLGKLLVDGNL